jgi:hypothetical protein
MIFREIDIEQENRDMDAIRKEIAEHQIATFGHVLTQEEIDANREEYRRERMARFEGLTNDEAIALMQREADEWAAKVKKYGFDYDDKSMYDEDGFIREDMREREIEAVKRAFSEGLKGIERHKNKKTV